MRLIGAALCACMSTLAIAADRPVTGPAPAWVRQVTAPASRLTAGEAPIDLMLQDQQVDLQPGIRTSYSRSVMRIGSAQGLSAGNIAFAWNPEFDTPVVHALRILRGDKVIDVLKAQSFTVIRRETNLEGAALDGVLTATLQPEGLQVGDTIEFAMSIRTGNPTLGRHVEFIAGGWSGVPIGRAHFRAQWSAGMPLRFRMGPGLPALVQSKAGGLDTVELTADDLQPYAAPRGAPPRYLLSRLIEVSDYADWAEVGALMAPLYARAAEITPNGPIEAEVGRIRAASPDPARRAEAVLGLVQDRIRYVALLMSSGDYVPAPVETTWQRRYGDCKGKTALLLALLHALGIKAEPVAVNAMLGDGIDARRPMAGMFNHVLVRATIEGKEYWLDGTRSGDRSLAQLEVPGFAWGLPLVAKAATLVRLLPPPLERPGSATEITIDARKGITRPTPMTVETILRGDNAYGMQLRMALLTADGREKELREYWRGEYNFVDLEKVGFAYDPALREARLTMSGLATMEWKDGWYETDGTGLGYEADFRRDPGPDRDAPYAVGYPYYGSNKETILLPDGFAPANLKPAAEIDQTVAGTRYRRRMTVAGRSVTIESSTRSLQSEFPAADAPAAQAALRKLNDDRIYLRRPDNYVMMPAELSEALKSTPTTADDYVRRAGLLMQQDRKAEALGAAREAVRLDPKSVIALSGLANTLMMNGEHAEANKVLAAAEALAPGHVSLIFTRAAVMDALGDAKARVAAWEAVIKVMPSSWAASRRAIALRDDRQFDLAILESRLVTAKDPHDIEMFLLRMNIHRAAGRHDLVAIEAEALMSANPDSAYAHVAAAKALAVIDRRDAADTAFNRALAIKPEAYIYLNRSQVRPRPDLAGRMADVDAALKLEPDLEDALSAKAGLQAEAGDFAGADAILSRLVAKAQQSPWLVAQRGFVRLRAGRVREAETDFAAARTLDKWSTFANNICWAQAIEPTATPAVLAAALGFCDAAIAATPTVANYFDSRGLVLLRLGRNAEALASYDRAVTLDRTLSKSLFGRAVARSRQGDRAGALADAAAADRANGNDRDFFSNLGQTIEKPTASSS